MIKQMDNTAQQDVDVCAILNTFMYLDYKEAADNATLSTIIKAIENKIKTDEDFAEDMEKKKDELTILQKAVNDEDKTIANMVIGNQSCQSPQDYNEGTHAATFKDASGKIYIAFRGTGDGEWPDNGIGMTAVSTPQQREALKYYDKICDTNKWNMDTDLIITGHSKGGNKAQYITLNSENGKYIDKCYSLDGQGFSADAVEAMKKKKDYNEQLAKMYSINGENDFVNGLGHKVIKEENTFYVDTPVEKLPVKGRIMNLHHITGMFAREVNGEVVYGGKFNDEEEQGLISINAKNISDYLMTLSPDKINDTALVIMQAMELTEGRPDSINGEPYPIENIPGFIADGAPSMIITLLSHEEGRELFKQIGARIFDDYYKKHGAWGVVGLACSICIHLPAIALFSASVAGAAFEVYRWAGIIENTLDFLADIKDFAKDAYNFVSDCAEKVKAILNEMADWYIKHFDAGHKYSTENPYIRLNTYKLYNYATQLEAIQRRLHNLDYRLDSLYGAVIADGDLPDLLSLIKSDILTGNSRRLQRCIDYLNETAADFERAESKILKKLHEM